jgi:hypothetical protein
LETRRRAFAHQDVISIAAVFNYAATRTQFDFAIFQDDFGASVSLSAVIATWMHRQKGAKQRYNKQRRQQLESNISLPVCWQWAAFNQRMRVINNRVGHFQFLLVAISAKSFRVAKQINSR